MSIAYWIYNYAPEWEAASKEVATLHQYASGHHDCTIFSFNKLNRSNRIALTGPLKSVPIALLALCLPLIRRMASRYAINHIFASLGEPLLLRKMPPETLVLTVSKDVGSLSKIEKNRQALLSCAHIIVECERHREILYQIGVEPSRLSLVYPGLDVRPIVNPIGSFKIVFATASFYKHELLDRGIHLMLRTASRLRDVTFILIWRHADVDNLRELVRYYNVENNVVIRDEFIPNMGEVYDAAHACILPGLAPNSFKPCPHSLLEGLAHGKPGLVSNPTSLSAIVDEYQCGVTFDPTVESLEIAIAKLRRHYTDYVEKCHFAVENVFSREHFLQRYSAIYDSLLPGFTDAI